MGPRENPGRRALWTESVFPWTEIGLPRQLTTEEPVWRLLSDEGMPSRLGRTAGDCGGEGSWEVGSGWAPAKPSLSGGYLRIGGLIEGSEPASSSFFRPPPPPARPRIDAAIEFLASAKMKSAPFYGGESEPCAGPAPTKIAAARVKDTKRQRHHPGSWVANRGDRSGAGASSDVSVPSHRYRLAKGRALEIT